MPTRPTAPRQHPSADGSGAVPIDRSRAQVVGKTLRQLGLGPEVLRLAHAKLAQVAAGGSLRLEVFVPSHAPDAVTYILNTIPLPMSWYQTGGTGDVLPANIGAYATRNG